MQFDLLKITDIKKQLADMVLAMRTKHAISQAQLAENIGVSRITIQNIEASKNVTLDTLLKVLQYFDLLEKFNLFLKDETNSASIPSLY